MKIRNLTPHPLVLGGVGLQPEGVVPRVKVRREMVITADKELPVPVYATVAEGISDLPAKESGVLLIVSRVVAEAARERSDLVFPDELVRDPEGNVIGARSLGSVAEEPPRFRRGEPDW